MQNWYKIISIIQFKMQLMFSKKKEDQKMVHFSNEMIRNKTKKKLEKKK